MKLLRVVLLLLPLSTCLAAVVNDFTESCPQFFPTLNGVVTAPTRFTPGTRFKQICQTLNNSILFATHYDTANRIPVYTAYGFRGRAKCTRKAGDWFIEPQLEDSHLPEKNMALQSTVNTTGHYQALNGDYVKSRFDKGHLLPVYHANCQTCATATFTLTNAAPQTPSFNRGQWRVTEKNMVDNLNSNCTGLQVYVVTGVVPGNNKIKNRVRIPSHFWTAYCCIDNNNNPKHARAAIGENKAGANVDWKNVADLEQELTRLYLSNFTLFGGQCHIN